MSSKESRIQRATRIVTIMQLEDSGHWTPCDHKGNDQDQETAEYVKHVTTGKVYKWNQQKRIAEHEESAKCDVDHKTTSTNSDTVELSQLIDRMFEIVDRLERVNQKVG